MNRRIGTSQALYVIMFCIHDDSLVVINSQHVLPALPCEYRRLRQRLPSNFVRGYRAMRKHLMSLGIGLAVLSLSTGSAHAQAAKVVLQFVATRALPAGRAFTFGVITGVGGNLTTEVLHNALKPAPPPTPQTPVKTDLSKLLLNGCPIEGCKSLTAEAFNLDKLARLRPLEITRLRRLLSARRPPCNPATTPSLPPRRSGARPCSMTGAHRSRGTPRRRRVATLSRRSARFR